MKELVKLMQAQFDRMCATGKLFRSNISGQEVYDTYLRSFTKEDNPVFRDPSSSVHKCNNCSNFIRRYGNIVAINGLGQLESIFNVTLPNDNEYFNSINSCSELLTSSKIESVFFETYDELNALPYEKCNKTQPRFRLGIAQNFKQYTAEEAAKFGKVSIEKVYEFNHFHLDIPTEFVDKSGKSIGQIEGIYRDKYSVFKRTMEEVSLSTYQMCIDLIKEGALVNSDKYISGLEHYIKFKTDFDNSSNKENYCWSVTYSLEEGFAKFGNSNIGTNFLKAVEKGEKELDYICEAFNKLEDPSNKFKANSAITNAMKVAAMKTIEELGIAEQFNRRHTTLDDITANTVAYINRDATKAKINLFEMDEHSDNAIYQEKQFDKVEEIGIEEFMNSIGNYSSMEILLKNDMSLFNMTSTVEKDLPSIFKYGNNHSFTVNGDLAGESAIKEAVRTKGGAINGVLMCRLLWNDHELNDQSDLDLWCKQPDEKKIGFNAGYRKDNGNIFTSMSGQLDLDDRGINDGEHVENIYFVNKAQMKDGVYKFWVNQWSNRNSKGFKADIEFGGEIFQYTYDKPLSTGVDIAIATVTLNKGVFTIQHHLECKTISSKLWNLDTLKFHKVSCVCPSPNHWNTKSGTLHYLFAIKGCYNDKPIKTFHIDNLMPELLKDRKALQILAEIKRVEPVGNQFAGVCFNATYSRTIIARVKENSKTKVIKVKI